MYWPLMSPCPARTPSILAQLAEISVELSDLEQLLTEGWRDQIVAGVACLFHPDPEACLPLVWGAFDSGSWASPQLGVCAMLLEPDDPSQAQRRLLLRCPVETRKLEGTDPMWRHVVHGSAALKSHSTKAMAALLETLARSPEGRDWLVSHLSFEEAYWALEVDFWDHGENLSRGWSSAIGPMLAELGKNPPAWLLADSPKDLLGLWEIQAQPPEVGFLCRGDWETRIERFFLPFVRDGHRALILEGDSGHLRLSSRTPAGNQVLLQLHGPYYEALWRRLEFHCRDNQVFLLPNSGQDLAGLRVDHLDRGLSIDCLKEYQPPSSFQICDRDLEQCKAHLWVIGIDSQARFDGGVAAMVASLGGEELVESVRFQLAQGDRRPGSFVLGTSELLQKAGVREVACLVTLPKPGLSQLCSGLQSVLEYARQNCTRLAMPALGCGAAGFQAREVAGPLLAVLARYREDLRIALCLPGQRERSAFEVAARRQGLI